MRFLAAVAKLAGVKALADKETMAANAKRKRERFTVVMLERDVICYSAGREGELLLLFQKERTRRLHLTPGAIFV